MSNRKTSTATRSATSSPESADGHSQPASPGGRKTASCGPARARASRSRQQESSKAPPTLGICGPTFVDSLPPAGPLSSWENRLRQRLACIGSTECVLTWKQAATKLGRLYSRLVPSTHPTAEIDCGLWPTVVASEVRQGFQDRSRGKKGSQESLTTVVVKTVRALWPTPRSSPNENRTTRIPPSQLDGRHGLYLSSVAIGMEPAGSSATTEKPGALNPQFVCWLMGFPPEWDACAPTAMPSSRKSRQK